MQCLTFILLTSLGYNIFKMAALQQNMQFDGSQIYCEPWERANQSDAEIQEETKIHFAAGRILKNGGDFVLLCAFVLRFKVNDLLSVGSTSLHFPPASA